MAISNDDLKQVRFRCIELAITAVRDRIEGEYSTGTDAEILETAKKFEEYVLAADEGKTP